MTHSVQCLIMQNELSETRCISSQQRANSVIPHASADAKMHRPGGAPGDGGDPIGTNPPLHISPSTRVFYAQTLDELRPGSPTTAECRWDVLKSASINKKHAVSRKRHKIGCLENTQLCNWIHFQSMCSIAGTAGS